MLKINLFSFFETMFFGFIGIIILGDNCDFMFLLGVILYNLIIIKNIIFNKGV